MNINKTYLLFYLLAGYVTLQFIWWAYLLVDLNTEMALVQQKLNSLLTPENQENVDFSQVAKKKIWMIVGEGSVFLILLLIGYEAIRRSISRQFKTALQQNNFLLAVTHELKTPISAVKLLLQTTQKRKLSTEVQNELITKALVDTDRLENLTENILVATRLGQEAYSLNKQEINLNNWFQEFIQHYKNRISGQKQIQFEADDVFYINADLLSLDSIFGNLIDNALKYAEENSEITIKLFQENSRLQISIHNWGEPISGSDQKQIFNRFFRSGNEQTRKTKGTGLGLYIVKQLVELHGGKIKLESNKITGTKFQLTLPNQMPEPELNRK